MAAEVASSIDAKVLAAGLCMGLGAVGSAIGQGLIGMAAMSATGRNPEVGNALTGKMILAMALTESTAIYSLVIAILILFVV